MSSDLVAFDTIRAQLEVSENLADIRSLRDKADAARVYVRNANLGLELQNKATELKLRAERKAGMFLARLRLRGGDRKSKSRGATLNLADLGITNAQSARWQLMALVPESTFSSLVAEANSQGRELTSAALLRTAKSFRKPRKANGQTINGNKHGESTRTTHSGCHDLSDAVEELKQHRALLIAMLGPVASGEKRVLETGEVKGIGHVLREIEQLLTQAAEALTKRDK